MDLPDRGTLWQGLTSPAEALGSLYVLEGSALGRRVLIPGLRRTLGGIPTAFFDPDPYHPDHWRNVQRALAQLDGGLCALEVVGGAQKTFAAFLEHFTRRSPSRAVPVR
jgi:heme oxygenase